MIIFLIAHISTILLTEKNLVSYQKKKIQEDNVEWVDQKEVILIKVKLDGVKFK